MTHGNLSIFAVAIAVTLVGCKSDGAKCVPGASVECACVSGAKGVQVCKDDGTFEPCQCQPASASDPENLAELERDLAEHEPEVPAGSEPGTAAEKYLRKTKTAEASQFVKKLYDGARAYYLDTPQPSFTPVSPRFPGPSTGPTPSLGTCCRQGGKCKPEPQQWETPVWIALQFSVDDPHYYSYEYVVEDVERSFVVRAYGDLDCDGVYSTFEMRGEVDPSMADGPSGNAPLTQTKPLE